MKTTNPPRRMNPQRFVIGERVNYVNHVAGYEIALMEVTRLSEDHVYAKKFFGRQEFKFDLQGIASWSCNLSIQKVAQITDGKENG